MNSCKPQVDLVLQIVAFQDECQAKFQKIDVWRTTPLEHCVVRTVDNSFQVEWRWIF